jgi:hypothetical protein
LSNARPIRDQPGGLGGHAAHGFAVAEVGKHIYAVSGVNNAGGAGTLSVVPVNEVYEL